MLPPPQATVVLRRVLHCRILERRGLVLRVLLPAQPPPPLVLREPDTTPRAGAAGAAAGTAAAAASAEGAGGTAPRAGAAGAAAGSAAAAASAEGAGGATRRAVVVGAAAAPPLRVLAPAPCLLPTRATSAPCLCRAGVLFFVARLLKRRAARVSFTIRIT